MSIPINLIVSDKGVVLDPSTNPVALSEAGVNVVITQQETPVNVTQAVTGPILISVPKQGPAGAPGTSVTLEQARANGNTFSVDGIEADEAIRYNQDIEPMLSPGLTSSGVNKNAKGLVKIGISTDTHHSKTVARDPLGINEYTRLKSWFDSVGVVDITFHLADLQQTGDGSTGIATIDAALRPANSGLYYAIGNHDAFSDAEKSTWRATVTGLMDAVTWGGDAYYSFESDGILYLVLDPLQDEDDSFVTGTAWTIGGTQRTWIQTTLEASPTMPTVVLCHISLDSDNISSAYYKVVNSAAIRTLLETYGNVVAFMSGHAHTESAATGGNNFNIIEGIKYFVLTAFSPDSSTRIFESYEASVFYVNKETSDVYKEAVGTAVPQLGTNSGTIDSGTETHLYVDTSGVGDGYSAGAGAVATLAELQALIPKPFTTNVMCHLSDEDWSASTLTLSGVNPNGEFTCKIQMDRPTPEVSGTLTANATAPSAHPGFYTLTDTGAFVALTLAGKYIEFTMLAGVDIETTNEGVYARIISHTDDVLTIDGSLCSTALTGDTFHVYAHSVDFMPEIVIQEGSQAIDVRRMATTTVSHLRITKGCVAPAAGLDFQVSDIGFRNEGKFSALGCGIGSASRGAYTPGGTTRLDGCSLYATSNDTNGVVTTSFNGTCKMYFGTRLAATGYTGVVLANSFDNGNNICFFSSGSGRQTVFQGEIGDGTDFGMIATNGGVFAGDSLAAFSDCGVNTYRSDTFDLFAGDVLGNVTGNVSGSSGSCTGNSATSTLATTAINSTYNTAVAQGVGTRLLASNGFTGQNQEIKYITQELLVPIAELNQLSGLSVNVTDTNLNTLTGGIASEANPLHVHKNWYNYFILGTSATFTDDNAWTDITDIVALVTDAVNVTLSSGVAALDTIGRYVISAGVTIAAPAGATAARIGFQVKPSAGSPAMEGHVQWNTMVADQQLSFTIPDFVFDADTTTRTLTLQVRNYNTGSTETWNVLNFSVSWKIQFIGV